LNEYQFKKGPIYIGRHTNSHVFLPDKRVSRHHAVLFRTQQGQWLVEDLDSANKTLLNNAVIHKAGIKTGDRLTITDFTIEIDLEAETATDEKINLEDTVVGAEYGPQVITRKLDEPEAADIKMPASRAGDFAAAAELICEADNLKQILEALVGIAAGQFRAFHTFCALRSDISGPMTVQAGRGRDGRVVKFDEIILKAKIAKAVETGRFMLLPRLADPSRQNVHSAIIAPVKGSFGCYGVLYIDNSTDDEPYNLSDLDYAMLLVVHTATVLKNF